MDEASSTRAPEVAVAIERADLPELPALVAGWVTHQRYQGVRHGFRHRLYQWLVDLDSLPRLPRYLRPFAGFRSEDHLGDPGQSIKQNIEYFLARHGIDLGSRSRIVMLANGTHTCSAPLFEEQRRPRSDSMCHRSST